MKADALYAKHLIQFGTAGLAYPYSRRMHTPHTSISQVIPDLKVFYCKKSKGHLLRKKEPMNPNWGFKWVLFGLSICN